MIKKYTFSNYKCFSKGISVLPPCLVNLIIGKNNSGKSSLLDYFELLLTRKSTKFNSVSVEAECEIDDSLLQSIIFRYANQYGFEPNQSERKALLGKTIIFDGSITRGNELKPHLNEQKTIKIIGPQYFVSLPDSARVFESMVHKYSGVFKLAAERDVKPETKNNDAVVSSKGDGIVSKMLFHRMNSRGSRMLIDIILNDLNEILIGECSFSKLEILEIEKDKYEIMLTNSDGLEIPLSEMGSGIKTILLTSFVLNQRLFRKDDSVLFFEELENNLHPEVQRRLFSKVYDYAIKNNCPIFITSHSNVAINTLFGKDNTMVYHVYKEDENASNVRAVSTASGMKDMLDDLGVKANDIFQTNGILWVEGPSDRVYLNKWINIIDGSLMENVDYTFLYYGGKLLSHYSADNAQQDLISILLTNRNSAILIDSDLKEECDEINDTKKRIFEEFSKNNCFCWITKGREIENYINKDAINRKYGDASKEQIGVYEDFKDYIVDLEPRFENNKVAFAKSISFTKSDLDCLDLNEKILELVDTIKKWNS